MEKHGRPRADAHRIGGQHVDFDFQGAGVSDLDQRPARFHYPLVLMGDSQHTPLHRRSDGDAPGQASSPLSMGVLEPGACRVQVVPGSLHGELGGKMRRPGLACFRLRPFQLVPAGKPGLVEFLRALVSRLRVIVGGGRHPCVFLRRVERRLRGFPHRLRLLPATGIQYGRAHRLQLRQDLAANDVVPHVKTDAADVSHDGCRNDEPVLHPGFSLFLDRDLERAARDFGYVHGNGPGDQSVGDGQDDRRRDGEQENPPAPAHSLYSLALRTATRSRRKSFLRIENAERQVEARTTAAAKA